jgi:hypothetical protein
MKITLMADYCSSGIWNARGLMLDMEDLPITKDLQMEIYRWCMAYEPSQFYLAHEDRARLFDIQSFNQWGDKILDQLRRQLPKWIIVHHKIRDDE